MSGAAMTFHRSVELSDREVTYLGSTSFLPQELADLILKARHGGDNQNVIAVTPEIAERFREVFTERLARVGFGPDYEPTSEGKLLEGLIDRFFVGVDPR